MSTSPKPSLSYSQQPSSSSGSNDSLLNIGGHRWLRLLVLALALYLVLLPLWWVALDQVALLTATLADWVYHLFDPLVTINPDGKIARVYVSASEQSGFSKSNPYQLALRMDTVTYGMPMFAALVLATRADSVLAKARGLFIGVMVMTFLTVFAVMMWAKLASLQLDERIAQGGATRSAFFYYTFHGYAFSQPVVAVGLWLAFVLLGVFKTRVKEEKPVAVAVSRNALCPCGSGRKYKRCCGNA